jgi:hypothetical protein
MKRREFIQKSALASLAFAVPQWLAPAWAQTDSASLMQIKDGRIEYRSARQRFAIINSRNVIASVTAQGKVRLSYPAIKPSFNGQTPCKAWVLNSLMVPMLPAEIEALSGEGLALPEGSHTLYIYWIDPSVTSVSELRARWWEVMMNPETFQQYSAAIEYVILEVKNLTPAVTKEVKMPADIQTAAWYPQYQETPHKLSLPANKVFGITKRVAGVPPQQLVEKGLTIQAVFADVNNGFISSNNTWICHRAYAKGKAEVPYSGTLEPGQSITLDKADERCKPDDIISIHKGYSASLPPGLQVEYSIPEPKLFRFKITNSTTAPLKIEGGAFYAGFFKSVNEEAENFYNGYARAGTVTTAEFCENGVPFRDVERIYQRIYQLQVEREGVASVSESNLVSDYFANLYGWGTDMSPHQSFDAKRQLFSSAENARKSKIDEAPSSYYTDRAYEYRHRFVGGYLDGIARLLDASRIYYHIANLERQYIAMADRKVLTFSWPAFEGVNCVVERSATEQRLPFQNGDLIRTSRPYGSFEQLKFEAFFSLLIGDYFVLWDDNAFYGNDASNFGLAHIGGPADWKNQWQPRGGQMVQYNAAEPTHPKSSGGPYQWSDSAAPGHNGAFCGAWLLSQIKNCINQTLEYAVFSYTAQSTLHSGYYNGNEPVKGEKGDAEISRLGQANAGQFNIINQEEHRKPIVLVGSGTAGKIAIILYPFAGLTETVSYQIVHGGTRVIQHTGPALGVYVL